MSRPRSQLFVGPTSRTAVTLVSPSRWALKTAEGVAVNSHLDQNYLSARLTSRPIVLLDQVRLHSELSPG